MMRPSAVRAPSVEETNDSTGESLLNEKLLAYDGSSRRNKQDYENPYAFNIQSREEKARIRKLNEEYEQDPVGYVSRTSQEDQYKVEEYRKQGYGKGLPAVKDTGPVTTKLAGKVGVAVVREKPLGVIRAFREFAKDMKKVIEKHTEGKSKP